MLIVRGSLSMSRPGVLIAEPTEHAAWALRVAADLSPAEAPHIDVLLSGDPVGALQLARWVRQQVRATGRRAHVNVVADKAVDTVVRAARHAAVGLLLGPDVETLGDPQRAEGLIEKAECALLLLR